MADKTRGMGRGLSAILSPAAASESSPELRELAIDLIAPNPRQPRTEFDPAALAALADSLRERGVLQPVLVRPVAGGTYELIAGERRWRAASFAGFDTIPALVRPHDDAESLELALIENMAREDLNAVEAARACALLADELGMTHAEIGRRVGRSRVAVSNLVRLLDLPDEALDLIAAGRLSEGHGRALLLAEDHAARRRLARAAAQNEWTVRRTEDEARAANGAMPARVGSAEPHPDQAAAAAVFAERLSGALGSQISVKPRPDGYTLQLSHETAETLLDRLS